MFNYIFNLLNKLFSLKTIPELDTTSDILLKERNEKYSGCISTKLTCYEVRQIKAMRRNGSTYKEIAKTFNVSTSTISRIVNNKTHKECE